MMYHPQVCYQSACSYYNYLSPLGIRQPKLFLSTIIPRFYHFSKDLSQQKHLKQMLTEETHEATHFQRTTKDEKTCYIWHIYLFIKNIHLYIPVNMRPNFTNLFKLSGILTTLCSSKFYFKIKF